MTNQKRRLLPLTFFTVFAALHAQSPNTASILVVVEDPIYLTEPHIISKSFQLTANPMLPVGPPCVSTFKGRRPGEGVPHFVPEKNPFVDELTKMWHLPREAVLGYTETLYPEYRKKIKATYTPPPPCAGNCGGPAQGAPPPPPPPPPR